MTNGISSPTPANNAAGTNNSAPERFHLGYRRSLDGLRGVAILMVVIEHLDIVRSIMGFVAVDMFFVLSGFLITCLLIEEWRQTGGISLRAFYARRALRLLPALIAMFIFVLVYAWIALSHRAFIQIVKEVLAALFYSVNWVAAFDILSVKTLTHTWSLSIEEQFYLIWPALLLLLLRRSDPKSIFCYVLLGALLSWLTRSLLYAGTVTDPPRLGLGLDTRADSLLLGCAVGVLLSYNLFPRPRWLKTALWWSTLASAAGLLLFCLLSSPSTAVMYCAGWFIISLCTAVLIAELITTSGTVFHRVLESRVLVYVGSISYGLYVWHYPVMRVTDRYHLSSLTHALIAIPIIMAVTLASYYLLELPCLRIKKRFQKTT